MSKWVNYFLKSKNSRLTNGHLHSKDLYKQILEHDGTEAYCCYFDLDQDSLKLEYWNGEYEPDGTKIYSYLPQSEKPQTDHYKPELTFTQYEGICKPALDMISFDFDSENLQDSLDDVREFVKFIGVDDIVVFFSGSKGFHVMVPWGYFPLEASPALPRQLKDMAKDLKEKFPTLDTSIYNYNRKFRVPFSKHDKSGLFKFQLCTSSIKYQNIHEIIETAKDADETHDFLSDIKPALPREPLPHLVELYESVKRKSYEIEKAKAGTKVQPSNFEKFDGKLCIKKMLEQRCDDIGRNNACLRIVNDFYRSGKLQAVCEKQTYAWAKSVGLPLSEVTPIINNVYSRNADYNFGCQDECKAAYCSAKCDLWRKIAPDKRPEVADAPSSEAVKLKKDFDGVVWVMSKLFQSYWDEETKSFSLGLIVKQGSKDLFYYKDDHWQYLEGFKIDVLKVRLNAEFKHQLSLQKIDAIFNLMSTYIPHVPDGVDMFSPKKEMANFTDGTLHLVSHEGRYSLRFKEHDKENFCTSKIRVSYKSYKKDQNKKNGEFEAWLWQYVQKDKDKYMLVQEMFAASLMPAFPQFFVLLGASGTGKSTIMKILKRLHDGASYICGVSPDKFNGFHMQSMVGSLLNIVMDIKTSCRIDDDVVKQVDDGEPIRIERKKLDDIYAPIPPLHIFGANKMPTTMEGYSGALNRRFSIINFDMIFTGVKNKNIANDLFDADPQGILNFALNGLFRLVEENNGNYTHTESSQKNIDSWVRKSDVLSQFLDNIKTEGIKKNGDHLVVIQNNELSINKPELWHVFKLWQSDALEKINLLGKMKFYSLMSDHGFKSKHTNKGDVYLGLGLESELEGNVSI